MPRKQKFPHLLGSKWTACYSTEGWRHFQVANRKQEGSWVFAELVAACDPTVRLWVNAKQLKNRSLWQAGWQPLGQAPTGTDQSEAADCVRIEDNDADG